MPIRPENLGNINIIDTSALVSITNSAGWIVSVANTGGSVVVSNTQTAINIINSANWIFAQSNTGGLVTVANSSNINIANSAGWIFSQSNTAGQTFILTNSGGLYAQQSGAWAVSSTILNSSGLSFVNTTISIINTAGWVVTIANTGGTVLSQTIANTANWVVAVSNTAGMTATVINSSNLNVTDLRPAAVTVTTVVSTIGLITILAANTARLSAAFYNDSTQPCYLKLGASATTTSFTLKITSSALYEIMRPTYTGVVTALWNSAQGTLYVSETT